MSRRIRALCAAALSLTLLVGPGLSRAGAEVLLDPLAPPLVLGVSGNAFTINGTPRFLLCASYFAGIRASSATISSDFEALADKGFNCVRVWADWYYEGITPPGYKSYMLMDDQGAVSEANLTRLESLISEAFSNGLIVDLTFTRDTIARIESGGSPLCMELDAYMSGVARVASELAGYKNVFFDLQNESNHYASKQCPRACDGCINLPNCENAPGNCAEWYLSPADCGDVADFVRPSDQTRLLTISSTASSPMDDYIQAPARDLEIAARHCCGGPTWVTDMAPAIVATRNVVGNGIPIHLQESNRCPGYNNGSADCSKTGSANQFVNAAVNAKDAGAAGWTLHNPASFELHLGTLIARMNTPAEIDALNRLASVLGLNANPPPPPVLLSPPNGATTTTTPTFSWRAVVADPPVNNYKLQIRRTTDGGKVFGAFVGNVTTHTLAPNILTAGQTYKWRARAFNAAGKSAWSPYRTFTVQ